MSASATDGAMMAIARFKAALACLALAGCAAGPDFRRPASPPDSSYLPTGAPAETVVAEGASQAFTPGSPVAPDWWRLFAAPELDAAMRDALAYNPTLQSAQAALRASEENLRAGYGIFFPQVDVALSGERQRTAIRAASLRPGSVFNVFSLAGTISYLLDVAGSSRRTVEALSAQAQAQRYDMFAAWLSLSGNLANAFIARAAYAAQMQATRELVARQAEQVAIARAQVAGGSAAFSAVLSLQSQLAGSRAQLAVLQQRYEQAGHLLSTLAGRTPGQWQAPQVPLERLALPRNLPLTLPSALVRQRPDILAAEARLHVASANVGVASAALFPSLSLSASYGGADSDFSNITNADSRFWSTGAVASLPVFRGGTLVHQRQAAVEAYSRALADYRQAVLSAFAQVADILTALDNDARALQAQAEAVATAREALALLQANYQAGLVNYLDVLVATAQLQRAQVEHIQARAQRLQDSAALYLALGGGWWGTRLNATARQP